MERRKFLIGAGSLAAGSAAAMGTGAFTSVQADRGVTVAVADDSDALLAIRPEKENGSKTENAKEYVNTSGGTVSLDFGADDINEDPSISGEAAAGINQNATTIFDNLLQIQNQGTQSVYVGYRQSFKAGTGFAMYHEDPEYDGGGKGFVSGKENDGQLNIGTAPVSQGGNPDLVELSAGETLNNIGAFFFGKITSREVTKINNGTLTFVAADEFDDL